MGLLQDRLNQQLDPGTPQAPIESKKTSIVQRAVREQFKQPEPPEQSELPNELEEILEEHREEKEILKQKRKRMFKTVLLALVCAYLLFLIYGVLVTGYQYGEDGKVEPVVLSVKEIGEKENYDKLKGQYDSCKQLYEKILLIDYRFDQGVEDLRLLAPEYEALLDDVESLTVKTSALDVETKYTTIKSMLLTWIKTDVAIYLQKISSAVTKENADDAAVAYQYRSIVQNDFLLITQNLITLGENTKGAEIWDMKTWSPDGYIQETVLGKEY